MSEKKRVKIGKINIHMTNKWFYSFIAIFIFILAGGAIFAVNAGTDPAGGHAIDELSPPSGCSGYLKYNSGNWECSSFESYWNENSGGISYGSDVGAARFCDESMNNCFSPEDANNAIQDPGVCDSGETLVYDSGWECSSEKYNYWKKYEDSEGNSILSYHEIDGNVAIGRGFFLDDISTSSMNDLTVRGDINAKYGDIVAEYGEIKSDEFNGEEYCDEYGNNCFESKEVSGFTLEEFRVKCGSNSGCMDKTTFAWGYDFCALTKHEEHAWTGEHFRGCTVKYEEDLDRWKLELDSDDQMHCFMTCFKFNGLTPNVN